MMTSFYNLLKYAQTGIASPDMTYYDKLRANMLMGGAVKTLTGQPPLSFKSNGTPLISWSVKGNGSQSDTPTPDNPVMPTFCGKLVGTDWTIPITCAGQTTPVYLGQTQTVRRVKKVVLDGTENWNRVGSLHGYFTNLPSAAKFVGTSGIISSHYQASMSSADGTIRIAQGAVEILVYDNYTSVTDFKAFLAAQYAAGTPVVIWYVLATPSTGIVNEPLCKIGDYADELHSEDAAVTIPTVKGSNTLTVDTTLQPSEMSITYRG